MTDTARLCAALAALGIDAAGSMDGADAPGVTRARLAGLLHWVVSGELREAITSADCSDEFVRRWNAAAAHPDVPVAAEWSVQAWFDAHWLDGRICALTADNAATGTVSAVLDTAAHLAEAIKILLYLHVTSPSSEHQHAWLTVLDDLAYAYHRIRAEHIERTKTSPLVPDAMSARWDRPRVPVSERCGAASADNIDA